MGCVLVLRGALTHTLSCPSGLIGLVPGHWPWILGTLSYCVQHTIMNTTVFQLSTKCVYWIHLCPFSAPYFNTITVSHKLAVVCACSGPVASRPSFISLPSHFPPKTDCARPLVSSDSCSMACPWDLQGWKSSPDHGPLAKPLISCLWTYNTVLQIRQNGNTMYSDHFPHESYSTYCQCHSFRVTAPLALLPSSWSTSGVPTQVSSHHLSLSRDPCPTFFWPGL